MKVYRAFDHLLFLHHELPVPCQTTTRNIEILSREKIKIQKLWSQTWCNQLVKAKRFKKSTSSSISVFSVGEEENGGARCTKTLETAKKCSGY